MTPGEPVGAPPRRTTHVFDRLLGEARLHYRSGVALVALLLLVVVVTLPFTLSSIWDEMTGPPEGEVFHIGPPAESSASPTYARLHLAMVVFDDLPRLATIRITGQYVCPPPCGVQDRLLLFSLAEDEQATEGLAYSTVVAMPTSTQPINTSVQLPLRGHPVRYPFDEYELWLGVVPEQQLADGQVVHQGLAEASGSWFLTVQEKLPRLTLIENTEIDPRSMETDDNDRMDLHYAFVHRFTFQRPAYLRVLSLLLVLLVTAAAAFAVFLRPLQELVLSAGGLVLGVWGIRSIISPSSQAFVSAIDLSLALVILFLLGAIAVRALTFLIRQARPSAAPPVE
jgi:hypothetical protein